MNIHISKLQAWLAREYRTLGVELMDSSEENGNLRWTPTSDSRARLLDSVLGTVTLFSVLESASAVEEAVQSDIGWALDESSTLDVRSGLPDSVEDTLGAWQVHLLWIVPKDCKAPWEAEIRKVRQKSAHAEEVGIDLIDIGSGTLEEALGREGIPALLFNSRRLLRKDKHEVPVWMSPDATFESELKKIPLSFNDSGLREMSARFVETCLAEVELEPSQTKALCLTVPAKLRILNFRNIVSAELPLEKDSIANIIHGPNGTGKSSLIEALSLAIFGSSQRMTDFLEDGSMTNATRSAYSATALKRFGTSASIGPSIDLGGQNLIQNLTSDKNSASEMLWNGRGTILEQERAREFLTQDAVTAARRVLGDYSKLARRAQARSDSQLAIATSEWQDWLRESGLNASITKPQTILRKLLLSSINKYFPRESTASFDWLRTLAERFDDYSGVVSDLRERWDRLDSDADREQLADRIASALEKTGQGAPNLRLWLEDRNRVRAEILRVISESDAVLEIIRDDWPRISSELDSYIDWTQRSLPSSNDAEQQIIYPAVDSDRISAIKTEMANSAGVGQLLRAQRDHLEALSASFLPKWCIEHPKQCPTCEAEHPDGIVHVVGEVARIVVANYELSRATYAGLQDELRKLQSVRAAGSESPISVDRIQELSRAMHFPSEGIESIEGLALSRNLARTMSIYERLLSKPSVGAQMEFDLMNSQSHAVISEVLEVDADGKAKRVRPEQCKQLKTKLDAVVRKIVEEHLPETLGAVWEELCFALAPASWNHPAPPKLTVSTSRGVDSLGVLVTNGEVSVPARHVLNQAEQHVLGLAWFFTSYLTHGRFVAQMIALDDPAQEMDQVTYRRFVRFLQSFSRLHKSQSVPLQLIVALHQEDRALNLARAISDSGALTMLEWSKEVKSGGADSTVRQLILRNPEQGAPRPVISAGNGGVSWVH